MRLIYKLFISGLSVHRIAKYLTEHSIPTPGGGKAWYDSSVKSILTNEKYKGDALLQKEYVSDFLQKTRKKNAGVLSISGTGDMWYILTSSTPWMSAGWNDDIKSVDISSGITSIANHAFEWLSITSITIPETVTSIGGHAFAWNSKLTTVTLGSGVETIGEYAFTLCTSLKSISLPQDLQKIGESAFYGCTKLKTISIPKSVKTIGERAFEYCSKLKTVTFKGAAPKIKKYAFYGVTATVYYPSAKKSWKASVRKNYGGKLKWVAK